MLTILFNDLVRSRPRIHLVITQEKVLQLIRMVTLMTVTSKKDSVTAKEAYIHMQPKAQKK